MYVIRVIQYRLVCVGLRQYTDIEMLSLSIPIPIL